MLAAFLLGFAVTLATLTSQTVDLSSVVAQAVASEPVIVVAE